jgi:ABC-type multidrug transport system ATPase subunit
MTALMGSSGAGKTTLMDVIALRKRTGTVTGDVRLNGWPQEPVSFRRASGYVEQFDVQSSQLTVRETVLFSARLRLDPDTVSTDEDIQAFVDQVMDDVELSSLGPSLVGTDEGVGLSFEQKKRLSIAVELAASPAVLFLDEPTSGLDARSAQIVVRVLKKIALAGRTICATIHQPSSSVFGMFDYLLMLKTGGQVVYNGPVGGKNSEHLVNYFESKGAQTIELGENPANWMLRVVTAEGAGDLAETYVHSEDYTALLKELDDLGGTQDEAAKLEYDREFAVGRYKMQSLVNSRLQTIYWRSPAYNFTRILVSLVIAFVLGSAFVTSRNPAYQTESSMRARLSVIFLR